MKDPINEEIHKYREEQARRFNFDLAALCRDLRAWQRTHQLKVVRLPPQKISPRKENGVRPNPVRHGICDDNVEEKEGK
jgi:hypothetical protein